MSQSLQEVLDAARQLPLDEQRELASKLLSETARPSLTNAEINRNREIVRRTHGTIKGLDRATIISLAEDEEYCGY
jgi:hypothetical protein